MKTFHGNYAFCESYAAYFWLINGFTQIATYKPTCHRSSPGSLFLLSQVPHLRRYRVVICSPGEDPDVPSFPLVLFIYWLRLLFWRLASYMLGFPYKLLRRLQCLFLWALCHTLLFFPLDPPKSPSEIWIQENHTPLLEWLVSLCSQVKKAHMNMCFSFHWA